MTFLALVGALLLEQARALSPTNPVYTQYRRYLRRLEAGLDSGTRTHGVVAWLAAVVPPVATVLAIELWLGRVSAFAALLFQVLVLYMTLGFRRFGREYREVHDALREGDVARAQAGLARWRGAPADQLAASELARLAIERGLTCAHRHVFGVIAWFVVFGAAGALLYRLAALLSARWGGTDRTGANPASAFGGFSADAFAACDWLPARLTAVSFAIVGDFEDALFCWRSQAQAWPERAQGIVLAAGAGAIGVRLGSVVGTPPLIQARPELGTGEEADAELMTSAVGLVWRALVLWLFVILLLTVATWFGAAGS